MHCCRSFPWSDSTEARGWREQSTLSFTNAFAPLPTDLGGAINNAFNNSSPDYYVGFNLNLPFRNRVAKADQYRSELEYRQSELRARRIKKQIRIEVRNAQYALEQNRARLAAARKARDLANARSISRRKSKPWGRDRTFKP